MSAARKNATPLAACRRPRRSYKFAASLRSTSQALRTCGSGVTDRQTVAENSLRCVFSELSRAASNGSLRETTSRRDDIEFPLGAGRRGSWPRSLGPSLRRRQSANASESEEGHDAADSPPPIGISSEPNRLLERVETTAGGVRCVSTGATGRVCQASVPGTRTRLATTGPTGDLSRRRHVEQSENVLAAAVSRLCVLVVNTNRTRGWSSRPRRRCTAGRPRCRSSDRPSSAGSC